jgi:hypothetical protein
MAHPRCGLRCPLVSSLPTHPPPPFSYAHAGRSQVDTEYLKNIVLKLYRSGEAEALLPVFSALLAFSPDEMRSCRDGLARLQQVDG